VDIFIGSADGGVLFYRNLLYNNSVSNHSIDIPACFSLYQNYPNPFNPTTTIPFALPTESRVKIAIYNILGQRIAVLEDGILQAGNHKALWDGRSSSGVPVASGIYILTMEAKGTVKNSKFNDTNKMLLLK